ncbi:MAG: hypothetical protein WBA22_12425 [Candidatus Methanofastidiosia archaeon]
MGKANGQIPRNGEALPLVWGHCFGHSYHFSNRSHLDETPGNVAGVTDPAVDYIHPQGLTTVPSSTLRKPIRIR